MGRLTGLPARMASLPPRVAAMPKVADRFYQSPEWMALRRAKRAMGTVWCVVCGSTQRLILDHIKEIKDGGASLDIGNTQWLCHVCHQRKTARERAKRASGRR